MARPNVPVILASAIFAILVVCSLLGTLGFPDSILDLLNTLGHDRYNGHGRLLMPDTAESTSASDFEGDRYLLGVAKADITGPVAELNLMGYADANQIGTGLRQRLFSRAFIVADVHKPENRFVYIVLDTQSGDTAVRYGILDGLKELGPDYAVYGQGNIAVTGTHSHSGPGAWLNYLLPQITSKGFDKQSHGAIVEGAIRSIRRAHESLTPGRLSVGTTKVKDANINRSLYAYLANPESERQRYEDDVDKTLTLLRFQRDNDGKDIGVLTWFAVHGTSLYGNNTLVTGDNKGVAARLFEEQIRKDADNGAVENFVAGFSQANVGDTTPNVLGAFCENGTNVPCKFEDSTCGGTTQACHGRGPFFGRNDGGTKSCLEIGRRQYDAAYELLQSMRAGTCQSIPVRGSVVRSLHTFVDFSDYRFRHPNGTMVSTCPAALGYSFAAGTSDGPGAFDFTQGDSGEPNANPFWAVVRNALHAPTKEQKKCQAPKPILLDVGEVNTPYAWTPNIVDVQLLRVGQLLVIVSPGEATTMAGRRWREAVAARAPAALNDEQLEPIVLLGGPANTYTHYITTEEEYSVQRYEGASTLYGPHTLNAYIDLSLKYLPYLSASADKQPESGPFPPNNINKSLSFIGGVGFDRAGFSTSFGDVLEDVDGIYRPGETVRAKFVGANPRNNLRLESTYVAVERWGYAADGANSDQTWVRVRDDADYDLVFEWRATALKKSEAVVRWETSSDEEEGRYRLRYWGDAKSIGGAITGFEGVSGDFVIARAR